MADMATAITLSATEQARRAASIAKTGSAAPVTFAPISPVPDVYDFVGHAAGYGAGRRWGFSVRIAILHVTEGDSNIVNALHYEATRSEQVSCTAMVDGAGRLGLDVAYADRPWTTGRWNDESVTLEVCGWTAWTEAQWRTRPAQLARIADWLEHVCRTFNLPAEWLDGAAVADGASRQSVQPFRMGRRRGISDHRRCNDAAISLGGAPATYSHTDIGDGLRAIVLADIIPNVARRLAPRPDPTPTPTPQPDPLPVEDDMTRSLFRCSDADAAFFGWTDARGIALQVEWTGSGDDPNVVARIDAQIAAGAVVRDIVVANLMGVSLVGPLPEGDSRHQWTGREFGRVLG